MNVLVQIAHGCSEGWDLRGHLTHEATILTNLNGTVWSKESMITCRNEVVAKVIFLHLFVILFTGGVSSSVHAGIPLPPQEH